PEAGLRTVARQVEVLEKVGVLRPEIALAREIDVLALVFPGRDRREAGRLTLRLGPQIEVDRWAGRTPWHARQRDRAFRPAEIGAVGEEMGVRIDIGARRR